MKGFRGQPMFLRGLVSRCGLATQPLFEVLPHRRLCRPELGALYPEDMVARVTTVLFFFLFLEKLVAFWSGKTVYYL